MISSDSTLAMDNEKVIGDSQDRHILYGKHLSKLFIVAFSGKKKNLKVKKLSNNVIVYPICYKNPLSYLWDAYKICSEICKENKIDVITTQDPLLSGVVGYLLKRKFKIPLNIQLHGDYLENEFWLKDSKLFRIWNIIGKFIVRRADSLRVVSNIIKDTLKNKLNIPTEKIITFPVFTDITKFENKFKSNVKEKYRDFDNIVLFVGALIKRKNVESLLSAAIDVIKKYPKTLFLIVGDGEEKSMLRKMAAKLEIKQNIRFEGRVAQNDLYSYYHSCDIFILPSREDGWGRVVIEALACRKSVIVSNACGVSDIVNTVECGFVFPVDRSDVLAEKIIYLLDNPKLREEMGRRGKELVLETLDIRKNAYKYRELFERTIKLAKDE